MDIIGVSRVVTDMTFSMINITSRIRYCIDYYKYKKYIKRNKILKNKYYGETCYIIGNGPSIRNLEINLIKDKYTFVVNKFYKSPIYNQLKPNFYCVYDKYIFEEIKEDLDEMIEKNKETIKFFFNRRAIGKIKDRENCHYVYSTILPTSHNNNYDLTKNSNTFLNVIPFAIMCAIYMGFTKIVLLGCDFSLFASRKESHFYDEGASIDRKESLFQDLQGHAIVCCQHNYLKKYAKNKGIEIVNATPNSLLDVYPQVDLKDYL